MRESKGVLGIVVKRNSRITSGPQAYSAVGLDRRRTEGHRKDTAKKKVKYIEYLVRLTILKSLQFCGGSLGLI